MSLLNDALRKKERELDTDKRPPPLKMDLTAKPRRGARKILWFVLVILLLGIGTLWFGGVFLPTGNISLSKTRPKIQEYMQLQPADTPSGVLEKPERCELEKANSFCTAIAETKKPPLRSEASGRGGAGNHADISAADITQPKIEKPEACAPEIKAQDSAAKTQGAEAPFYGKAQAYHKRGDLEKAISMYREVLRKNPKHMDANFNLASAYLERGAFAEAYPILEKLHLSDKKSPWILLNLAIAELGLDRPKQAMAHLDEAEGLNHSPQFEICFHRGIAWSRLSAPGKAEACYKQAESFCSDHSGLLFNLAVLYDRWQRYDDALKYYEAFLRNIKGSSDQDCEEVRKRVQLIRVHLAMQRSKS